MSNIGELLGISEKSTSAFKTIFAAVGAIADIAGAVAGIGGAISVVEGLLGGSKDQLAPVIDAIKAAFDRLNEHQKGADIAARLTNLDEVWALAQSTAEALKATLEAMPPVDSGTRIELVGRCREAIDRLIGFDSRNAAGAFRGVYQDQVYYDDTGTLVYSNFVHFGNASGGPIENGFFPQDIGYRRQAPDPDANDLVFAQAYVLPLLLYVESLFLTVGAALIPNFYTEFEASIASDADYLMVIHDKIRSGIRFRIPDPFDLPDLLDAAWISFPTARGISQIVTDDNRFGGVRIDYGTLELYSGTTTTGAPYLLRLDEISPGVPDVDLLGFNPPPDITGLTSRPELYHKFQLRVGRQLRDLYRVVGLTDIWAAANMLRSFIKRDPLPGPLADYSLRHFCQIPGDAAFDRDRNAYSLGKLHDFLVNTPPRDTPQTPVFVRSMREVLIV